MRSSHKSTPTLVAAVILAGSGVAAAQDFKPFIQVENVCPKCPLLGYDHIKLKDGQEIDAVIVAENPMFYVITRHSELRAVGRDKVDTIDRSSDARREPGHEDQILLKSGLVFSGKIVREREDTGMYEIQIPPGKKSIFAYKPLIAVVFKGGTQVWPAAAAAGAPKK